MKHILPVLVKIFVIPFYRVHAGLLLFVFIIMFGVVESSQLISYHQALIYAMLSSPIFMLVVMLVWALYSVKSLHFMMKLSSEKSYQFLQYLTLQPLWMGFSHFFIISLLVFLPVLVYTIGIYLLAFENHYYLVALYVFGYQLMILGVHAWILTRKIHHTYRKPFLIIPTISIPFLRSQVSFYFAYLFKEEKAALIVSKLFSLALLYFVKETLEAGDDFRIVAITWLFTLMAHTFIVLKVKTFEDQSLQWIRGLPISSANIYGMCVLLYSLLMLPELLLISGALGKGISLYQLFLLPLLSAGFLAEVHTYLYKPQRNPDRFTTFLFWLFLVCFMLMLSNAILLVIPGLLLFSFILFRSRYFSYEPVTLPFGDGKH